MTATIERDKWSSASQRASGSRYEPTAVFYEGIRYRCHKCKQSFVLPPEDQKVAYEEKQKFIWWLPSLCPDCHEKRDQLLKSIRQHQLEWNAHRTELATNRAFLEQWRSILKEVASYGPRGSSSSHVTMISKLLEASQ